MDNQAEINSNEAFQKEIKESIQRLDEEFTRHRQGLLRELVMLEGEHRLLVRQSEKEKA